MNQTEHAEKFAQCSRNLRALAEKIAEIEPEFFTRTDVAKTCIVVALDLLLPAAGPGGSADFLRTVADQLDAGEWTPTVN